MSVENAALKKAHERLDAARVAFDRLASAKDFKTAKAGWTDFVIHSNRVFTALQQATKKSAGPNWMGEHNRARREDPLLSYILHARNAEEHGVDSITELSEPKLSFVKDGKVTASIVNLQGNKGTFELPEGASQWPTEPPGTKMELRIYPQRARLVAVYDSGLIYKPPTRHLGRDLEDSEPATVAARMLDYLQRMVSEVNGQAS